MSGQIIATVKHVREEKLCTRGMREWLLHHNFDVTEFVVHGLPAEQLEATGDAFGIRVAARARKEFSHGQE